jgi:hypothetical protein
MAQPIVYKDSVPVDDPAKGATKAEQAASAASAASAPKPKPKPKDEPIKKMAKGGSVSSRADGIAQRGRTNCKMV